MTTKYILLTRLLYPRIHDSRGLALPFCLIHKTKGEFVVMFQKDIQTAAENDPPARVGFYPAVMKVPIEMEIKLNTIPAKTYTRQLS